ncbi:MAG: CBS domain-containing protein [Ardenticatenaceae bacterium]|nr:CBS domain-containing protein [Anaerolineales bacterium]MCB8941034.1 CBS domain-containing protein [Ardenticatenaceae bacterium]MCB8972377.1 CBS domain-containing protein [Ardenticatenaceae bacterium]
MKKELVRNWMTQDVITVTPQMTLPEAHQIMMDEEIRRLPVVDAQNYLVGIVTLGDVRGAQPSPATSLSIWELNYLLSSLTVEKIMTPQPMTITPDATIGDAARTMLEHRVSGLPVINPDGKLAGIITESDIFSMVVIHEWSDSEAEPA